MRTQLVPEMIHVKQSTLVAWKAAHAYVTGIDMETIQFAPIIQSIPFGVEDSALCAGGKDHVAPDDKCSCGFHAWHDLTAARFYFYEQVSEARPRRVQDGDVLPHSFALLRVSLYGSVIRGYVPHATNNPQTQWAFKASNQWVHDVFFDKKCAECKSDKVELGYNRRSYVLKSGTICRPLRPLCERHIFDIVTPERLMERNDVVIHLGLPSE